jgi:hypothetical protein
VSIPWDADIPIFLWAMARVVFGGNRRARQNPRAIPVHPAYEEIPGGTLTQAQKDYFQSFDEQLAALNYRLDCTYRITNYRNYGHNLIRRYLNPMDSAACSLIILELKLTVKNVQAVKTTPIVFFTTRFSDEKQLTTRNMPLKSLNDEPPTESCRSAANSPIWPS